ncbi:phosphotransferase [Candidatus Saccharibacteria bacterium]|nr:phosphotransferase [Candidatus Saccharibacteria bacterium]
MFRLNTDELARICDVFGLHDVEFTGTTAGYRNTVYMFRSAEQDRCLLVHKQEHDTVARLRRVNNLGWLMHAAGLPVRYPADTRILRLNGASVTRYATLQTWLPGETVPWEAYSMKHIKLLGWAMAELHGALRQVASAGFPSVVSEYEVIVGRMERYFSTPSVRQALASKLSIELLPASLELLKRFLTACRALNGQQLLHMDFVRGNVLYRPSIPRDRFTIGTVSLSGIIDFEKAAIGHPLFDIARTLAFLLVDCSGKTEAQIRKYFLQSGYQKRGQSQLQSVSVTDTNGDEYDVLETAIDLFVLYDIYKFLRDNPYESLLNNYHFVRTRDLALHRKLLQISSLPSFR